MSQGIFFLFNYLLLFLIFLGFYALISFFIYYRKKIDFASIRNIVLVSVLFVLVKFSFEELLLFLNSPIRFSEIIYLLDTFILVLALDILEAPQRYLRRISSVFIAVIMTVFIHELLHYYLYPLII